MYPASDLELRTTSILPTPRLSTTSATMSRYALLFLLFSFVFSHALSCSCDFGSFADRYNSSAVVLKARAVSNKRVPLPPCPVNSRPCLPSFLTKDAVQYTFRLLGVLKGCSPRDTFFALTDERSSCRDFFQNGKVYLLNLEMQKGTRKMPFKVHFCQGNALFGKLSAGQKHFLKKQSMKKKNMCMN